MIVRMNDKKIEIFAGAKVRDVLLKYSEEEYRAALSGQTLTVDKNNNPVDLDGEISNGQRLYVKGRVAPATQDATPSAEKSRNRGKICFSYKFFPGINKKKNKESLNEY